MSKQMKKIYIIAAVLMMLLPQSVFAQSDRLGAAMADMYRLNTGSDIAIVTQKDAKAVSEEKESMAMASTVTVRRVKGSDIYKAGEMLASQESGNSFYMAGVRLTFGRVVGNGASHERLESMTVGGEPIELDEYYTAALGEDAAKVFSDGEMVEVYTSDDTVLYDYLMKFGIKTETEKPLETEKKPEGIQILQNQMPVLILAFVLLAAVIVLYFVLRKRKMRR